MIGTQSVPQNSAPAAILSRLRNLRPRLLALHKALLDGERIAFERAHGTLSSGDMLQVTINHEQFQWLHPIRELIVRIDEMVDAEHASSLEADAVAVIEEARTLLSPAAEGEGFAGKYFRALQHDPAAVLAHSEIKPILR